MTIEHSGQEPAGVTSAEISDDQLVAMLVDRARGNDLKLTGEGGLLQQLTKRVLESALEGEITDHVGFDKHDKSANKRDNTRNGHRSKTVITDVGPVEIRVPRDVANTFEPQIVRKRQRRLTGVDELVLSLSAKGLTHGEIAAHLAEVYGTEVSKQTISTITDKVMDGMAEWQNRPLDRVYPVLFIDAINVKIRDGHVANRPVYVALAVTADGNRDILGIWAGDGGEGAKYWLHVLTELKNRGVQDVLMLVCDGLKGLPDAVNTVWPKTVVQTCVVHRTRKRTSCCLSIRSSLIWYGRNRGRSGSTRGEMRDVVAASERTATPSHAGHRGPTARSRRGSSGRPDGPGQRDHRSQGRIRVGSRRRAACRRPDPQDRRWPQEQRRA
jgi:putative transposase